MSYKPPNIILIFTDQQHYRTLKVNGCEEALTPNLDYLASHGLNFRNFFVTNPVCSPSRGSLLSGQYITQHGLWANGGTLPSYIPTLPQMLRQHGYLTALFGKLHLIPILSRIEPHPSYGFEICEVAEGDQQLLEDAYFKWLRSKDPYLFLQYVNEMYEKGHNQGYTSCIPETLHLSTWITQKGIDFLKTYGQESRPFFLNLSYFDPHHAFNPCEPYASLFREKEVSLPKKHPDSFFSRPKHIQEKMLRDREIVQDKERLKNIIRAYYAMVSHIDHCIGKILQTLHELQLDQNTILIFTSDHGELLGNHDMIHKGPIMLDDLLRVPFIIDYPGTSSIHQIVDDLASGIDLVPTIMNLTGIPREEWEHLPGKPLIDRSFHPFPDGYHPYILAEWEDDLSTPTLSSIRCIRTLQAKLVYYSRNPEEGELYIYSDDPDEFFNRYHDPAYQEHKEQLLNLLIEHYLTRRPLTHRKPGW